MANIILLHAPPLPILATIISFISLLPLVIPQLEAIPPYLGAAVELFVQLTIGGVVLFLALLQWKQHRYQHHVLGLAESSEVRSIHPSVPRNSFC